MDDMTYLQGQHMTESKATDTSELPLEFHDLPPPRYLPSLSSSSSTEHINYVGNPCPRLSSQIPPLNFGAVVDGKIYRSAFPSAENLEFIEGLKLNAVLTLVDGPYPPGYTEWIDDNFVEHYNITLPANKESIKIKMDAMAQIMDIITDKSNYPLLIHCNKGKHRTGCVVGTYRKLCDKASMEQIIEEYHTYAGAKARLLDVQYLQYLDANELQRVRDRHDSGVEEDDIPLELNSIRIQAVRS